MKKSTRQLGKKLEHYVLEILQKTDARARLTNNSGAVSNDGDISHKDWVCECKLRNTESITIDRKVWKKVCSQIKVGSLKSPVLFLENVHEERFVVLELNDFARLITKE
jgi:hypothetical protein